MAAGFSTDLRNDRAAAIAARVDAAATAGKVRIYDGTRPATGAAITTQVLLAELTLADPSAPAPSGGVLTLDLDPDIEATAEDFSPTPKDATWGRVLDGDNNSVFDGDIGVTGSGAEFELDNTSIAALQIVRLTTGSITEGNA